MAFVLGVILAAILLLMLSGRKPAKFIKVMSKYRNINLLSAARLFLFGERDTWFAVGIPIYFYSVISNGSTESNRLAFS